MTFPTIPTVAAGRVLFRLQADQNATRTFPALSGLTKNAGDLLIAIVVDYQTNATANQAFSGWTEGFTEFGDFSTSTTMAIGMAYKWSTGSETGTPAVTEAGTKTGDAGMFLLSIPGAHASTPPAAGGYASGTTAAADPGALDPAGWATEDTLWIAVGGSGETSTTGSYTGIAAAPTNYTDYVETGISADLAGGIEAAVAFRQLAAASVDEGPFSVDVSNARSAVAMIAVRPAPAAATGTLSVTQADQTLAASGTVTTPISGTVAVTEAADTAAGAGTTAAGNNFLNLPDTDSWVSTPDHASLAVTDGLDVRIYMAPTTWSGTFSRHLMGQRGTATTAAWVHSVHSNGRPRFAPYEDGINPLGAEATDVQPFAAGQAGWLRATVDFDNGAGQAVYNYYSSTDGNTWTQIGTADLLEANTVVLFASTDDLTIPGSPPALNANLRFTGRVFYAEVRNGAGTIIANPDFRTATPGTGPITDSTGKVWTLHGNATIQAVAGTLAQTQAAQTSTASGSSTAPGVTGTVAVTAEQQTSAAAGTSTPPPVTGTLAATQTDQTLAATGSSAAAGVSGTVAATQATQTAAGVGQLGSSGTLAVTQGHQTSAATGGSAPPGVSGNLAVTQANQTSTATGTSTPLAVTGTVAVTQAPQTLVASGNSAAPSQGTVAVAEAADTLAAAGQLGAAGTVAVTEAADTLAAIGWVTVTGTLVVIESDDTLVAVGFLGVIPVPAGHQTTVARGVHQTTVAHGTHRFTVPGGSHDLEVPIG